MNLDTYLSVSMFVVMADTRTAIVELAEKLIRTKGYHGFSYKDISVPLAVKNAAVHYHFPAKADLGVEVIERIMQKFEVQTESWESYPPGEKLAEFLGIYQKSQDQNLVCFMGALGPVYDSLPEAMQKKLNAASEQILTWMKRVLKEGIANGQFDFKESIEEKADMIVASLLSSLILNKVTQNDVLTSVRSAILKTT